MRKVLIEVNDEGHVSIKNDGFQVFELIGLLSDTLSHIQQKQQTKRHMAEILKNEEMKDYIKSLTYDFFFKEIEEEQQTSNE